MTQLCNYTWDEISPGQTASFTRTVSRRDIQLFAVASGDLNPLHLDAQYAAGTRFGECIAHGMLTASFVSAALAMVLPGPGTIFLEQSVKFRLPVKIGDTITVQLEVTEKNDRRQSVTLDCRAVNQDGRAVLTGTATVIAPAEKLSLPCPPAPAVSVAD